MKGNERSSLKYQAKRSQKPGDVAQGLEQAAHNRLVVGSKPTIPTSRIEVGVLKADFLIGGGLSLPIYLC